MILEEGISTFSGTTGKLRYKYRQGNSDRNHLLIIFSGFRHKGTLDFGGDAIESIRHNVLWVYDEFGEEEENCYYLLQKGSFIPLNTVVEFLEKISESYGISFENMTFAGFSKGGSAALYFGLRFDVGAVIATVPQLYIGSYVQ